MKLLKSTIVCILILFCSSAQSKIEGIDELAKTIPEAQVLIDTRLFLRGLNEKRKKGKRIYKNAALKVAAKVERIAIRGCDIEDEHLNKLLRSQAYALVAGINGILSKVNRNPNLGRKSYLFLAKATELDPDNTDAIRGQAVALNMILSKGWLVRRAAATGLGINLKDAQIELIDDLRRFPERLDMARLADQLEDKL